MKQLQEYNTGAEEEKILLTRYRTAIESIDPSAGVILYGSRARGDAKPESDYDLLILNQCWPFNRGGNVPHYYFKSILLIALKI
jgi:predicted nucleotidyltransferase